MSFHTPEAKAELVNEFDNPHPFRQKIVEAMSNRKVPTTASMALDDFNIQTFDDVTADYHKEIINKAVGVKAHTGPVIALAYNLMRIVESEVPYSQAETHAEIENMLNYLGNTVFSQKHGIESLHNKAIDAICLCDVDRMVEMGFDKRASEIIVDLIRKNAAELLGITTQSQLEEKHRQFRELGRSNLINTIVRRKNKIYFATRANLHPLRLLEHLRTKPNDIVGHLFKMAVKRSTENEIWE